jgi:4-hydroxy-2-oxoheptanedioate aldolase
MIPHVMSLEEAKKIVYYTKFHPIGRRPIDGGNSDGAFCLINSDTYMKEANENRFTVIQIEDPEPLDELEEIASLPGIDMLFFGPADFSQGMGIPGQFKDPRITETRKRIAECARRNGKFAGTVSVPSLAQCFAEGYDYVNGGSDVNSIRSQCDKIMNDFNDLGL